MTRGVVYVAYGDKARQEMQKSAAGVMEQHPDLPIAVISDEPLEGYHWVYAPDLDKGARLAKLNLDNLSPYEHTLYLDADTRIYQPLTAGFEMLAEGFDLVIAPSMNQAEAKKLFWHIDLDEIHYTLRQLTYAPLQLQGGVMFFNKTTTQDFFKAWRQEWNVFKEQDQAALTRALGEVPLRLWLLGRPWNGGAVIAHHFGQAARKHYHT